MDEANKIVAEKNIQSVAGFKAWLDKEFPNLEAYNGCYDFSDYNMEQCWRASQANAENLRFLVHRLIGQFDETPGAYNVISDSLIDELRAASDWKAPETTEQGSPDGSPVGHQGV